MDSQVNYIRQRLSLRKPLAKALELTARITDKLSLNKPPTDPVLELHRQVFLVSLAVWQVQEVRDRA